MTIKQLTSVLFFTITFTATSSFAETNKPTVASKKTTATAASTREKGSGMATGRRSYSPSLHTKDVDKSSPLAASNYRKCPDGTMINPGEKCPEKAAKNATGLPTGKRQHKPLNLRKRIDKATPLSAHGKAGYRLCPDGTRINPGEKCPEKTARAVAGNCPDGPTVIPPQRCHEKLNAKTTQCPSTSPTRCMKPPTRAGYRLCPDGTKITHGQKCPEKARKPGNR